MAVAIAAQAIVLAQSFHDGKLSGPVPWDDCAYLDRGFSNRELITLGDLRSNLATSLWHLNLHAPVGDVSVLAGLLLFNGALWGPYAVNVLFLLIGMLAIDRFFHGQQPWLRVGLALFFLLTPFVTANLGDLKPDLKAGLFLLVALLLLFDRRRGAYSAGKAITSLAAAALVLAVAAKVTTFYMPFAIVVVVAMSAFGYLIGEGQIRPRRAWLPLQLARSEMATRVLWRAGGMILSVVLITGLIWWQGADHYLGYIKYALSPLWDDHLTWKQQLLYYTPGGPSRELLGHLFWIGLAAGAAAAILSWRSRTTTDIADLAVLGAVALMLLMPLLLAPTHDLRFGTFFFYSLLAFTLLALRLALTSLPVTSRSWLVVLLLGVGVMQSQAGGVWHSPLPPRERVQATELFGDFAGRIASDGKAKPRVVYLFKNSHMPAPNLGIVAWQRYRQNLEYIGYDRGPDDPWLAALLDSAQWLVTAKSPDKKGFPARFPANAAMAEIHQRVVSDGRFSQVLTSRIGTTEVFVFKRTP